MRIALAGLLFGLLLANLSWLRRDTAPPLWDSAHYLQHSSIFYRALERGGPAAFLDAFSTSLGSKAPLVAALPIPFYAALGEGYAAARCVNLAWIVVASWFLFLIARTLFGDLEALVAVVLLQTFPLVAGMSRQFLVEYGLMALVIVWIYLLLRWRQPGSRAVPWLLGIVLGFGLLMKVTFPLYIAAPTVLVLVQHRRGGRPWRALALDLLCIAAAATPVAATWYARNLLGVLRFVAAAGFGEAGRPYGTGPVFSPQAVLTYWTKVANSGLSGLYTLVLLFLLAGLGIAALRRRQLPPSATDRLDLQIVLAWWLVPFLALTFATNKDPRYTIAWLPALALLFVEAVRRLVPPRRQVAVLAAISIVGVLNFSALSFGVPSVERDWRVGNLQLAGGRTAWAYPPESDPWPVETVARAVAADAIGRRAGRIRVRVLFSHPRINAHLLNYVATFEELAPRFTTVHFQDSLPLAELIEQLDGGYDYLLTKSEALGPDRINVRNREVAQALAAGRLRYEEVETIPMPDGSRVAVHRNLALPDR